MKFIYNFSYNNNYNNLYIDIEDDFDDYIYHTVYAFNRLFIKNKFFNKKTIKGDKISPKYNSFRKNKNLDLNNLLINAWIKKGLKFNFLKNYNISLEKFFFLLNTNKEFYKNYPNFNFVFDLLNTKKYNYRFENLLKHPIKELEYVFDLRLKKLNKKMKRKFKKKYTYTVIHLHEKKRVKHVLNMFYASSSFYKEKQYYERIFLTFMNVIFDTKNTPTWERKLNVYRIALKFLNKK